MSAVLRVIAPGLHTTVQDLGRYGFQHLGVPVSGALDTTALRLANRLVGNAEGEAGLEIMHLGPTLEVHADSVRVALAGDGSRLEVRGRDQPVPVLQSLRLERGDQFRVAATGATGTAYLAVQGGFAIPETLGSRSTYARGGFGGYSGRALTEGDELSLRQAAVPVGYEQRLPEGVLPRPRSVRVVLGPQDDHFAPEAIANLRACAYTVSKASDRMGMRLEGRPLTHRERFNIVSDGIAPGAIQVPGDGLPIILLADRQTTGGYTKIATVISADLAALGRLRPGDNLGFRIVGLDDAAAARREAAQWFSRLAQSIKPAAAATGPDERLLHSENIIGGVVHAADPES